MADEPCNETAKDSTAGVRDADQRRRDELARRIRENPAEALKSEFTNSFLTLLEKGRCGHRAADGGAECRTRRKLRGNAAMPIHKLVIASGNPGKLAEFDDMLGPRGFDVRPQSDFDVEQPPETGTTFVENALVKARTAAETSGRAALGDDSGLVVRALKGQPGIYSSRFAGAEASDDDNIDKLIQELEGLPEARRGAYFYCCLVLLRHADDPAPLIATGRWHGYILESRRGEGGFGYDPVFHDPDKGATAAELPATEKNRVSHRGQAMDALLDQIDDRRI